MDVEKIWYNYLLRLYRDGTINERGLKRAVAIGWITEEESEEIIRICAGG